MAALSRPARAGRCSTTRKRNIPANSSKRFHTSTAAGSPHTRKPASLVRIGPMVILQATLNHRACPVVRLFRLDVGGLYDRPPFLNLRLLIGAQAFGSLESLRRNLQSHVGQATTNRGVSKRIDDRSVKLGDHLFRRSLGHPKAMPDRNIEARKPSLVDGRNVGRER